MMTSAVCGGATAKYKHWHNGKLRVSSNGRYLEHTNGKPFFWFGDTAWNMIYRITLTEARTLYFPNRQAKGMNVLQVIVTGTGVLAGVGTEADVVEAGTANLVNGEMVFTVSNGTIPNEAYFSLLDDLIDAARECNLYIALLPTWGSYVTNTGAAWINEIWTTGLITTYGTTIANRYKDRPNLIWVTGGDNPGDEEVGDLDVWRALGNALNDTDPDHLITYHPGDATTSHTWFHSDTWLDFNMCNSFNVSTNTYALPEAAYAASPAKPICNGEPAYEERGWFTDREYRSQPYWNILSGGLGGYTYGHISVFPFDNNDAWGTFWEDKLDDTHIAEVVLWSRLFKSLEWWKLAPDQAAITANVGTTINMARAAVASDGTFLVVYYPNNSSRTIDKAKITSSANATGKWVRPTDMLEDNSIGTVSTTGTQAWTPPGGWTDAVLILTAV